MVRDVRALVACALTLGCEALPGGVDAVLALGPGSPGAISPRGGQAPGRGEEAEECERGTDVGSAEPVGDRSVRLEGASRSRSIRRASDGGRDDEARDGVGLAASTIGGAEGPKPVILVAGGDVNLGRHVGQRLLADPGYDPFAGVRALLASADLAFVNLESPLSHQRGETRHPTERNVFTGPPSGADALARAGVDLVSVANNHAWDYQLEGFAQTLDHLGVAGVRAVGHRAARDAAIEPTVFRVGELSVAWLAATDVFNPGDLARHEGGERVVPADSVELRNAIARAAARHDAVIVSIHAGREYLAVPLAEERELLESFVVSGATAVIGHHAHVARGISWVEGAPVLHGLGNLVFGIHRRHPWTARSYLARLLLSPGRFPRVQLCPVVIVHDEPHRLAAAGHGDEAEQVRRRIEELSEPLGGARVGDYDADGCFAVAPVQPAPGGQRAVASTRKRRSDAEIEPELLTAPADDRGGVDEL